MFPVSRTSVELVSGTRRHAVNVAHWDPTTIRFEIPYGVPTGDYSLEVGTAPAAGNRLPLRVQSFPLGTARITSILRIGSATRLTWTSTRSGTPTSRCVVFEASSDLLHWTTIATNRPFGPAPWAFLDTTAPSSRRFYRINQGPFSAGDAAPDLIIGEIVATSPPRVIAGGRVEWPVRVVVRNQGNDSSSLFKIAVGLTVPPASGYESVPFTVPGQTDTVFPWTTLSAGAESALNGKVTFDSRFRGKSISLFATADSCLGDGSMPAWCRVRESYEFNNDSSGIVLRIP
jgi:hypothetical protein